MDKVLILTVIDPTERGDDCYLGGSAYKSVDSMLEALGRGWEGECHFDLMTAEDDDERNDIRESYAARLPALRAWVEENDVRNDKGGAWFCPNEELIFEFLWTEVR
ncbi:MAG: hypothetical protein A4E20_12130 [Nitrospira sp. SG-bin2]|uniref:hypothetical protein n=1 Tax=Nitrospira cf. moscoviensis SBR1015 TaxID=96242 RepID=UPI000A0D0309|nr:hypothetical protein [Nitrospira cf. moscoviensis SBR1015]OQW33969.1 MAG: hypothetical protein A4E20_12130 [Nitrospira sp. SG-bin2]